MVLYDHWSLALYSDFHGLSWEIMDPSGWPKDSGEVGNGFLVGWPSRWMGWKLWNVPAVPRTWKNMKNGETHENHIVNSWSTCSCSKLSKFLPSFGGDFLPRFRWRKEDRNWQSQRREDTLQGGNPKGLEMTTWNQWSPPNAILSAFYLAFYLEYILT